MIRADLLALTPEALVRLANAGLVKRARSELASGAAPTLTEEPDGTVVAAARDGATTRLVRGAALATTPCTCGAAQVCRHRIAAVLAYQAQHAADSGAATAAAWDPGTVSDAAVAAACGAPAIARAAALLAHGVVATVRPGAPPSVVLPTATVQFLVPDDLAYAKCDCARGHACEHVVLAVRAFRACPGGGVVTLAPPAAPALDGEIAGHVLGAIAQLAEYGLAAPGSDARIGRARATAERAGWWWIADALAAIERLAEAYQRQSARFGVEPLARETGEIVARLRAAGSPASGLPARWLVGSDRAGETAMEQTRLLALGARLDADDDRRSARLYFADPDTATVLVLDRTWPNETRVGAELGALFASSRMSIADLARGELVTRAARRRPNGALDLGAARGMRSSLLPTTGSWAQLPEPLLVHDLAAHAERRRAQPPACLSPRGLGANVAVVALAGVPTIDAAPDGQSVAAVVTDVAGNPLALHTEHRRVTPGAVDATLAALRATPTHVAGELERTATGWRMAPLAFLAPRLVVVDLQPPAHADRAAARRLAALFTRAADGSVPAVLDLAVLHLLDDA